MATYRRKLSREDVATGSVLIEKSRWKMFPPPMREFVVEAGGQRCATRIVAEDCTCVPPAHQHYHLEAGHYRDRLRFEAGRTIEIEALPDGAYAVRDA